jgi:large subunit ribosomal protein L10
MAKLDKKSETVAEIKDRVTRAKSLILVETKGLTVDKDTALRKILRELGVDYKVYKNTLVNIAVKDTEYSALSPYLKGANVFAFSYEDPTLAARVIAKNLKDLQNIEFRAGVIDSVFYDGEGVKQIAEIPSREELISKLLGSIKSPLSKFARLINAIAESKSEQTKSI